jgi:hypothetical protein
MGMTTTFTLAYEGPPVCPPCAQRGTDVCDHTGFNADHWAHLPRLRVHVPGLDSNDDYPHIARDVQISPDRKTVTITVETARPLHHDLARHLSVQAWTPPAAVRAVHHETGAVLEQGYYERPLAQGEHVRIDRNVYHVQSVEWPNRNEYGAAGEQDDLQIATLVPVAIESIRPVEGQ